MKRMNIDLDGNLIPIKFFILQKTLKTLIEIYSIQSINDALGKIYWELSYEEYDGSKRKLFDDLSEAYDDINNKFFVSIRKGKAFRG
jgi:hypothetical protein